jgi:putative Mg2+ transporter-C (MgtC) family protein
VALGLGSVIGFERQWRQRLAGLRTNSLVALGAAIFVTYSRISLDDQGAARMAAQVVSGIGFLGAGVIFKEGLSVRGLNTAATLWCSAAVGLIAGEGYAGYATLSALLVLGTNLLLRPIVRAINRRPIESAEDEHQYVVSIVCRAADVADVRSLLVRKLKDLPDSTLGEVDAALIDDADRVEVTATVASNKRREIALETIVAGFNRLDGVVKAGWRRDSTAS